MHYFDIHSHILPNIDDGAENEKISAELLNMMWQQGIKSVMATPHFYANHTTMEDFKAHINHSLSLLNKVYNADTMPRIGMGAELFYFEGIGKSKGIKELAFQGGNYILVELPNCPIDNKIIYDLKNISDYLGLTPILAHIERYAKEKNFKSILNLIENKYCYAQVNATSIVNSPIKKPALKLIKNGYIAFLGTDAHSPQGRPPELKAAYEELEKVFDKSTVDQFIHNSHILEREIFNAG